jgi:hypothetical protein
MNEQEPQPLQPRRSLLPLQTQPLDRTDHIIRQQRDLELGRVDSKSLAGHVTAA